MSDIIVKLSGISAVLGGRRVLSRVNLEIRRDENWAIIGPNGSGKTTILRIINGYLRPSSGSISALGEELGRTDLRDLRKKIGFVSSYMNDLISLDDNVLDIVVAGKGSATRLWSVPLKEDVREATKLLKLLDCSRFADKKLRDLSQGEKQKIVIARALMAKPKLFTLDEPCAGLDIKSRESFLSSLQRITSKRLTTMIYVTHRIEEIPGCFTHALLLKGGRVVVQGKIGKVLNPASLAKCFDLDLSIRKINGRYFPLVQKP